MTHTKNPPTGARSSPISDLLAAAMSLPRWTAQNSGLILEACALVEGLDTALSGCAGCFEDAAKRETVMDGDFCHRCHKPCATTYTGPSALELRAFPKRGRLPIKLRVRYGYGHAKAPGEAHCVARSREGAMGLLERWVVLDLERVAALQLVTPRAVADTIACMVETYDDRRAQQTRKGEPFGHRIVVVDGSGDDLRVVDAVTQVWA